MRWAVIRQDGKVRACIAEPTVMLVTMVDPSKPFEKIPALLAGSIIPLGGAPGISMTWEDEAVPLDGQVPFGTESGTIQTTTGIHIFGGGKN